MLFVHSGHTPWWVIDSIVKSGKHQAVLYGEEIHIHPSIHQLNRRGILSPKYHYWGSMQPDEVEEHSPLTIIQSLVMKSSVLLITCEFPNPDFITKQLVLRVKYPTGEHTMSIYGKPS